MAMQQFAVATARPLPVIILADVSGSMTQDNNIGALNAAKMLERINEINKNYDIKAIVGTANPMIEDILFISTQDVFSGNGMGKINKLFCKEMENYVSLKYIINKELKNKSFSLKWV